MHHIKFDPDKTRTVTDLRSLINSAASDFSDSDYLRYKRHKTIESITYGRFRDAASYLGTSLFELGLNGGVIGIIGETSPEWVMTYVASVISGCTVVPLDKELSHREIAGFISRAGVSCVFFSPTFKEMFEEYSASLPDVKYFVQFSDIDYSAFFGDNTAENAAEDNEPSDAEKSPEGFFSFEALLKKGRDVYLRGDTRFNECPQDFDKVSAILFTSGTTGTSKGVMITYKNLIASINASYKTTDFYPDDVLVSVLPIHHTYEMTCGILTPLNYGLTICINDSLKYVVKNFQLFKPTGLVLVPLFVSSMYKKIWETANKTGSAKKLKAALKISDAARKVKIDLRKYLFKEINAAFGGRLEKIICGGAALAPELVTEFGRLGIEICQGYGITECSPLISVCPPRSGKPGSVGLPVPGVEVFIDKEDPDASYGEILVRGDNVMKGYYMDEEATNEAFSDGWFRTGDYGYVDSDGYVYITGRKKNVIVLNNGKNVFPEEIEGYLEKIELISEVVVVARNDESGETFGITALVYPNFQMASEKGLTDINDISAAIRDEVAALNKTLPSFKQIRGIEIRKTEFEKTTSHKIKRYSIH